MRFVELKALFFALQLVLSIISEAAEASVVIINFA
ncbi:hypothetical protein PSEUDO9AZ_20529 [Pseudomonas sp. 9AZ]|nr:hypothetical protein PSEUDO9AZ_20529 [Pseudomonas sp. 9AZ]